MSERVPPGTVVKLILIGLSIEAACYLAAASVHLTSWSSIGVQTVALLPPARRLLIGVVSAPLVVGAVLLFVRWRRSSSALLPDSSRAQLARATADILGPLALLLIWTVPYIPGATARAPAVLLFAGPAKWIVLGLAIVGCGIRLFPWLTSWPPGTRAPSRVAVFGVSLLVYLSIGIPFSRAEGPGGDEPHYLVIAHSLLADRDLQIENNHRLRQYSAFVKGDLPPHFLHRGRDGVIYSVHAPGLPALLLPGYAAAGYLGAVVTMVVLGALVALAVFDLANLFADAGSATLTWVAIAFTVPLGPHAWLIYPELPAALLAAWAALWLWRPLPTRAGPWIVRGAALALWPWLHTKFLSLLIIVAVLLLVKLRARRSHAFACIAPIVGSLTLWVFSFWVMYGVASPFVQYGSSSQTELAIANIPRGVLGLFFDYKFGMLAYSSVYLVGIVGAWRLLRNSRSRGFGLILLGLGSTLLASVTPFFMWWGGHSAPARFIVPAIPLTAPLVAAGIAAARNAVSRAVVEAFVIWSVTVFGLMSVQPDLSLFFNDRQEPGRLVALLQGDAPLSFALPTFTQPDYLWDLRKLVAWIIAVGVAVAVGWAVYGSPRLEARTTTGDRNEMARRLYRAGLAFLAVLWVSGAAVSAVMMSRSDRDLVVNEGRARLMADYDARSVAIEYPSLARLSTSDLLRRCVLSVETLGLRERRGQRPVLAGPFQLEPGRFVARVWLRNRQREYHGTITLTDRADASVVARRAGPLRSPIEVPFSLPVPGPRVRVESSDWVLAEDSVLVEIEPRQLTSRERRDLRGLGHTLCQIGDREGAYVVFIDDSTYPEGEFYWTKGGEAGRTLVSPAGAKRLRLTLHLGPPGGDVNVEVGEHRERLSLSPGEVRVWEEELDPSRLLVPVIVTATGGFRPAAVDLRSGDQRWLGCQVRTELRDQ
ncbi:MAG: hypothetical protein HYS05_14655 [Acidobacteria bacterium]|nr:hypothetical protein [Acidobacteriota bacterium]